MHTKLDVLENLPCRAITTNIGHRSARRGPPGFAIQVPNSYGADTQEHGSREPAYYSKLQRTTSKVCGVM